MTSNEARTRAGGLRIISICQQWKVLYRLGQVSQKRFNQEDPNPRTGGPTSCNVRWTGENSKGIMSNGAKGTGDSHSGEKTQGEHDDNGANLSYAAQKTEPGPGSQLQFKLKSDVHCLQITWTA